MKIERYLSLGCPISFDFLPLKIKRLSDNQAESSVSVCENEKIRTTQGRGSTQFQLSYNTKTLGHFACDKNNLVLRKL